MLHDIAPPGATIDSATIDQGSCTVSATDVTCVISHLDGSAEADIVLVEPAGDALAGSTSHASISASQFDPTPSNDSSEATAPMPASGAPMADLVIQDHESSWQDTLGGTLIDTITVVNNGPGKITTPRPWARRARLAGRARKSPRRRVTHVDWPTRDSYTGHRARPPLPVRGDGTEGELGRRDLIAFVRQTLDRVPARPRKEPFRRS